MTEASHVTVPTRCQVFSLLMSNITDTTGIEITATHSLLNLILLFRKPTVTIDGNATKQSWRKPTFIATTPGEHQVQVHYRYWLIFKTAGKATIAANVQQGAVTKLRYKAPFWFLFLNGKIKAV